jgi:serine/threonine protein kinase
MGERQFGPYRLVHQIAVGGMAEIHLAKTGGIAGFEKYVALKMIHPNFSEDEQFIQMLIDEAKITVQLQHVNIAQTFDLGRVGEHYYITMEFVDGCDLYQLLRRSSEHDVETPADICAFIAKEVATGLDYAHRKRDHRGNPLGIVHRDVSPQNVLLSHAGEVKLVDFGIAKATMRARQTAVGVIKGKYYYMSPEQAWGDSLDHRSDVFSAGILLYEMLTGQMLYLEEDVQKLLGMVRKANIPPPSTLRSGIPPQLERIVMHCLQKRPDDRYRTAADLATDLERFLHVYSPVFTAGKLAKHIAEILDVEQLTPPPVEPPPAPPVEPPPAPAPIEEMRSARRVTQRVQRSELVRSREEFTDENSVIFNVHEMARGVAGGGPRMAQSLTREVEGEFDDDRTVIDDMPPMFDGATPRVEPSARQNPVPEAPDVLLDGDTTDVREPSSNGRSRSDESMDEDAPTMALDSGQHPGMVSGRIDRDPDPLDMQTERRPHKLPLSPAAEALAASNPRPAVSAVRQPRKSRRTPPRGVPSVPAARAAR